MFLINNSKTIKKILFKFLRNLELKGLDILNNKRSFSYLKSFIILKLEI